MFKFCLYNGLLVAFHLLRPAAALPQPDGRLVLRSEMSQRDEKPQLPFDPKTIATCRWWWDHNGEVSCQALITGWQVDIADFIAWNPSITPGCGNFIEGRSYCVEAPIQPKPVTTTTTTTTVTRPTTTTTLAATTTTPGNGIQTPLPVRTDMAKNCDRFHNVQAGEDCFGVIGQYGITFDQFLAWNPSVGSSCSQLWAFTNYCVRTIGFQAPATTTTRTSTTARPPATTTTGNGIATPTPIQPQMVSNCNQFYRVQQGDNCVRIGANHNIRASRIYDWNKSVGEACGGLWANSYVCVGTIGFTRPTNTVCSTAADNKTWGDNKPSALDAVKQWCDGNDSSDGSGGFATAQVKRGCFKAPFGTNKIEFTARNDFGAGSRLAVGTCEAIVSAAVNRCARGGDATQEGWFASARVVAGTC